MRTVVFISSCALDAQGRPGPFLAQELPWLQSHFDRVVVCDRTGVAEVPAPAPEHIAVRRPGLAGLRAALAAPFDPNLWAELRRLRADGRLTPKGALKLFAFALRGRRMHGWVEALLRPGETATFYAFWLSYDGYAAALSKRRHPEMRAVARAHAFDIDPARNPLNPYLMKRFIVAALDGLYPIGEGAKTHIAPYAPPEKVTVLGLGSAGGDTPDRFEPPVYQDGVFRIVSCSAIVPLKQVPLIVDALALWPGGRVRWMHIGGGEGEASLRAYAAQKLGGRPDIEFTITGQVEPARVQAIYRTHPFDVFLNVSLSEGIPVAIMEAMRAGLPTVAPAVGGIPELVDETTGVLYPPGGDAQTVLAALLAVKNLSRERAEAMRRAAQARWQESCHIDKLLCRLFPEACGGEARP